MKNFFKKLSFVLASAMVITSLYAPANAEAAAKNFVFVKGQKKALKSITLAVGMKKNLDYKVNGKTSGFGAKWKSSDASVVSVNKKSGVITPMAPGKATISYVAKVGKKKLTVKTTVMVKAAKVASLKLEEMKRSVKVGETLTVTPEITLTDEAMKLGAKKTSDKLFASSDNNEVASVSVDDNNLIIKGLKPGKATISFYAAASEADETKVEGTKFVVDVIGDLSADQTAANKITVKGKDLSKEVKDYEVKNDKGVAVSFKKDVFVNEDGTVAVLEADTLQIPEGKYTLAFKKDTTTDFTVENARVEAIEILPADKDVAVVSNNKKEATIYYRVLDQFKVDVTKEYMARNLQITTNYYKKSEKAGEVTVAVEQTGTGKTFVPNVDRISVSIVDTKHQKTATKLLTVSDEARVANVEFKGIWDASKRDFVKEIPEDADVYQDSTANKRYVKNYRLAFTAVDQYGNPFYGDSSYGQTTTTNYMNAAQQVQVNLVGVPSLVADNTKDKAKTEEIKDAKYLTYPIYVINNVNEIPRDGNVKVNAIVINTGKTASDEFEVTASRKVNSLEIFAKPIGVYARQTNILGYKALDKDGKEVTDWKNLKSLNPKFDAYNTGSGFLKFVPNSKEKRVDLHYRPADGVSPVGNTSITQVFSYVLPTLTFGTSSVVVRAQRYPAAIVGVDASAVRGATRRDNNDFGIQLKNIKFQDQFGNLMRADEIANYNDEANVSGGSEAQLKVWFGDLEKPEFALAEVLPTSDTLDRAFLKAGKNRDVDTPNVDVGISQFSDDTGVNMASENQYVVNLKPMTGGEMDTAISVTTNKLAETDKALTKSAKVNLALRTKDSNGQYKYVSIYTFRTYNVLLDDMYGFDVSAISLKPAQDLDNDSNQLDSAEVNKPNFFKPEVVGYYDGYKIALQKVTDFEIYESVGADKQTAYVPKMASIPAGKTSTKYTVTAYVHKAQAVKLNKEFEFSKEGRRVNKIEFKNKVNTFVARSTDSAKGWADLESALNIWDQYDTPLVISPAEEPHTSKMARLNALTPIIVISDYDDREVEVNNNGSTGTTFRLKGTSPSEVEIEIIYPYTSYRFKELVTLNP